MLMGCGHEHRGVPFSFPRGRDCLCQELHSFATLEDLNTVVSHLKPLETDFDTARVSSTCKGELPQCRDRDRKVQESPGCDSSLLALFGGAVGN